MEGDLLNPPSVDDVAEDEDAGEPKDNILLTDIALYKDYEHFLNKKYWIKRWEGSLIFK